MIDTLERYLFLRKNELDKEIIEQIKHIQEDGREAGNVVLKDDLRKYYCLSREHQLILDLLDFYGGV